VASVDPNKISLTGAILVLLAQASLAESGSATFDSGESRVSLIELFTSEGCSSCPPADAWISKLRSSPDLWKNFVPVVFHVDYWDHLGWSDRFAKAEFTARQRRYSSVWRSDSVYTPAFVVNGKEWHGWLDGRGIPATESKAGRLQVTLTNGTEVRAMFTLEADAPAQLQLDVALLGTNLASDVKRGENSRRKLRHDFVVLQSTTTKLSGNGNQWIGSSSLPKQIGPDRPMALAAWVSSGNTSIVQATGGWLDKER
jgi:hypothetical protein